MKATEAKEIADRFNRSKLNTIYEKIRSAAAQGGCETTVSIVSSDYDYIAEQLDEDGFCIEPTVNDGYMSISWYHADKEDKT